MEEIKQDENDIKMKKRLGVLEFCSISNSDDIVLIKRALVKFTSQVRIERKLALYYSQDETEVVDDDDDDDEEDEENKVTVTTGINGTPRWTRDVNQYNVPFVATSLSFGGDEGFVQRGQWPTGLLQAYLVASPRATELLVSLRQHQKTNDASFRKAYWFAIAELLTAFISSDSTNSKHSSIVLETIQKECLPEMCRHIENKYGSKKKATAKRKRDDNNANIATTKKEDGVTPAILYCFTQLLMVSTTSILGRDVSRILVSSIYATTLSTMLHLPPKEEENKQKNQSHLYYQKYPTNHYFSSIQPKKLDVSTGCVLLASAMLFVTHQQRHQQHQLLSSMLCSGTSKSTSGSYNQRGIVYLSFQIGFDHIITLNNNNYYFALTQFLLAIRQSCMIHESSTKHYQQAMMNKTKSDFFNPHGLVQISKLAAVYTPMNSLQEDDDDDDDTSSTSILSPLEIASIEARKLLLLLLGDVIHSPLYFHVNSNHQHHTRYNNNNPGLLYHQQQQQLSLISKTLLAISSTTTMGEVTMRQFVLKCFHQTPNLVPLYFKAMVPISALSSTGNKNNLNNNVFSSIASLSNLTHLINESPSIGKCWNAPWNTITDNTKIPDSILMCIYPTNCLTKVTIQRLLSLSSSSLLVIEALKLVNAVIQRCATVDDRINKQALMDTIFKKLLPDIPWLLSLLRTKLSVFFSSSKEEGLFFVAAQICDSICMYYSTLSSLATNYTNTSNVDVIARLLTLADAVQKTHEQKQDDDNQKLLPFPSSSYHVLLQLRLLQIMEHCALFNTTLEQQRQNLNTNRIKAKHQLLLVKCSSKTFKLLLQILASTQHSEIRNLCRNLVVGSLMQINNCRATTNNGTTGDEETWMNSTEQHNCLHYEATLWVDTLLLQCSSKQGEEQKKNTEIYILCVEKMFEMAQRRFMEHFIYAAQACVDTVVVANESDDIKQQETSSAAFSTLWCCFSPFLNFALHGLSELSPEFCHWVILVTIKCLFYHSDPTPLAHLVILHLTPKSSNYSSSASDALLNYSRQIVQLRMVEWTEQTSILSSSLHTLLTSSLTDVMENILQRNIGDDYQNCHHQALICKLFVSTDPKVHKQATLEAQEIILRDCSGTIATSIARQILRHLNFIIKSAAETRDHRYGFLKKCSYYQHLFTLLRCAIVATSAMSNSVLFCSVIASIYNADFFSEIQCSNHFMLTCVTLCHLHPSLSSPPPPNSSLSLVENSRSSSRLIVEQCLGRYTTRLCNWILSKQDDDMDCILPYQPHLHFLGALGTDLPNSSRIPLATALMKRGNDNLKEQKCAVSQYQKHGSSDIRKSNKWIIKELFPFLQGFLLLQQSKIEISADRPFLIFYEQIFIMWQNLGFYTSEDDIYKICDPHASMVLTQLEDIVTHSWNNPDYDVVGSSALLNMASSVITAVEMFSLSFRSVQRTWLKCHQDSGGKKKGRACSILVALLSFNCSDALVSPLLQYLSEQSDAEVIVKDVLWEAGILDSLMGIIFCEQMKEMLKEKIKIYPAAFLNFARRMIYNFRSSPDARLKLECAKACALFLELLFDLNDVEVIVSFEQIALRSALFESLVAQFPRLLRKKPHTNSSLCVGTLSNGASLIADAVFVVKTVRGILDSSEAAQCISRCSINLIAAMVLVCLKSGINPDPEWSLLASECLKTIHQIISVCRNDSALSAFLECGKPLDVTRIHEMALMHSQYEDVLSSTTRGGYAPSPKLELIKLQIFCVTIVKGSIKMDTSTWDILARSHNAGICDEDNFLRRLMLLCSRCKGEDSVEYFMDEFRTGPLAVSSKNSNEERWDWIFTLMDHHRIRCTLAHFPDWEPRLSPPNIENDVEMLVPYNALQIDDDDDSEGDDLEMRSANSEKVEDSELKSIVTMPAVFESQATRQWSGEGPDVRYSPAFVLPLLLGLLEYYIPTEDEVLGQRSDANLPMETHVTAQFLVFAKMSLRLCDNGGLALALASLSCKCPSLRQIALAVLLLLMKAICSEQARKIPEWRHRPQILMLLESVQRGLCVRRYRQMNSPQQTPKASTGSCNYIVPMFSSVSALFLARASLVLCNASDPMYSAVNSYFLRLTQNQGAFNDSGSRIPAFISLYCTTDDSGGRAKRERQWILFLLRDAIRDRHSFKAAIRCHATSLLLGAVDSLASSFPGTNDDTERVAVILALESMLINGGELSASHFLSQMGLLSWLHSFLVSRDCREFLPSLKARLAFLSLTSTAILVIHQMIDCEWNNPRDTVIEIISLSGSVLELVSVTLHQLSSGDTSIRWESSAERSFYSLIPICFWNMYKILASNESATLVGIGVNHWGISLDSAVTVLSNVKRHFEAGGHDIVDNNEADQPTKLIKLAWALASLPFRTEAVLHLKNLSLLTISIALQNNTNSSCAALSCVLQRIAIYADLGNTTSETSPMMGDAEILELIIRCRRRCVGNTTCMNAWKTCMASLLSTVDQSESDILIDTAKLLIRCS